MRRFLALAILSICLVFPARAQNGVGESLRANYTALSKQQRREFLKKLSADQMGQFIRETVEFLAKDKKPEEISNNWEQLAMLTGNRFEQWGEKLLAEKRRLTSDQILKLLRGENESFAWRVAFHGYLRIIFKNSEPRDAYEIGLTKDEVATLKREILKMQIRPPHKNAHEPVDTSHGK